VLKGLVDHNELTVVGAVYSLDTGRVEWLPQAQKSALAGGSGGGTCPVPFHSQRP
jgi:hypothetical protein